MLGLMKSGAKRVLQSLGLDIARSRALLQDLDPVARATIETALPYTMTSAERLASLCEAVRYIVASGIPGDMVECGVWRGGSMMAIAKTLLQAGDSSRGLYLFDTFEGMPPPTPLDVTADGENAAALMQKQKRGDPRSVWCVASLTDVQRTMELTGYPPELIHYVKGKVEETIPSAAPSQISVLRLDTDWYESTRHELEHLYHRLSVGGVLILDDYGHWAGARKAVDDYIREHGLPLLLHRVDYTGRIAVKLK